MKDKLFLSAVLNFVSRRMERREKLEGIIDTGVGFFTPEEILKAKESLHKLMQFTTRCKIHAKDEENFTENGRWIHQAHAKKTKLPTFVIDSPCSVPTTISICFITLRGAHLYE